MTMTPRLRKLALTAHVTSSVGWLGAVASFLALAVAGLTSRDAQLVRAAYLTMELTGWFILLPLALASLLTGLLQSLGTTWGLVRHYWVLFKLLMNVAAVLGLLLYMRALGELARLASNQSVAGGNLIDLRNPSPMIHSVATLLLLLVAVALSVYKPRGMTGYGRRKQHEQRTRQRALTRF